MHENEDSGIGSYVLDILRAETERDTQRLVGPSNMSNQCTYCLAGDLIGKPEERGKYYLGAKIGTATHEYVDNHSEHPTAIREQKNVIGTIPGYGTIKGSTDVFFPEEGIVGDLKTTTKEKLKWIKLAVQDEPNEYEVTKVRDARAKVASYQRQVWLYGKGWENLGYTVNGCVVWFVCRDGSTDKDIWTWRFPYSREQADATFDRAARLWSFLENGNDIEQIKSSLTCWVCSTNGRS